MHANHSTNPLTIWHDGCTECTARADWLPDSINDLDDRNRVRAWHYMRAYKWSGGDWQADAPSANDRKLLNALYAIAVYLERAGFPPGEVEARMVATHDVLIARADALGLNGVGGRELTSALNGIPLTGVFV